MGIGLVPREGKPVGGVGSSGRIVGRRGVTPLASAKLGGTTGGSGALFAGARPPLSDRARSAGMSGRHGGTPGSPRGLGVGTPCGAVSPRVLATRPTGGPGEGGAGTGTRAGAGIAGGPTITGGRETGKVHMNEGGSSAGPKGQGKDKSKNKSKSTSASPKVGGVGAKASKTREQRRPSASSAGGASGGGGGSGSLRPGLALHLGGLDSMLRGPCTPDHL